MKDHLLIWSLEDIQCYNLKNHFNVLTGEDGMNGRLNCGNISRTSCLGPTTFWRSTFEGKSTAFVMILLVVSQIPIGPTPGHLS